MTGLRQEIVSGFREDGQAALAASPDYFLWWYTAKSVALCVAVAALAFALGRASRS